jgi:hypothetical protein
MMFCKISLDRTGNNMSEYGRVLCLIAAVLLVCGSGCNSEPELHKLTGKVTLGGKSYNRLLVYFRPVDRKSDIYRLGVGETDAQGNLQLRSTAGDGLAAGEYRVNFSCLQASGGGEAIGMSNEKPDDNPKFVAVELVPSPYSDEANSPVTFQIKGNQDNYFEFDIPAK